VIPPAARLHQVYLLKDSRAVLNYSHELVENCPEGVEGEAALIYAVVNTLTRNISEIRSVRILIDGSERETLTGHLDLSGFLRQDMSLVRDSASPVDPAPVHPPTP
jgi:spore germination protein GerM